MTLICRRERPGVASDAVGVHTAWNPRQSCRVEVVPVADEWDGVQHA